MKLYKLTDENGCTWGGMQWSVNVTNSATGDTKQNLCSDGWIHAYTHPLLAVLLNPIGANFDNPRLWEAQGKVGKRAIDKVGCRTLTTVKELPLPYVTLTQRVAFGILATMQVYKAKAFVTWAKRWLSNEDRTANAANAAAYAANTAANAAIPT